MELTIDDLAKKCEKCDGTGEAKEIAQNASGGSIGRRVVATSLMSSGCQACSGSGRTKLTDTGRAIHELIKALEKNPFLQYS